MVIVGYPGMRDGKRYNLAGVLKDGEWIAEYAKQALPNYQVFDEQRYFTPGSEPCVAECRGARLGIVICEDLWDGAPIRQARDAGAEILVSLNASPYHLEKPAERNQLFAERAAEVNCRLVYVNQIGGQDELVFDGGSATIDADGKTCVQAPWWDVGLMPVQFLKAEGDN